MHACYIKNTTSMTFKKLKLKKFVDTPTCLTLNFVIFLIYDQIILIILEPPIIDMYI